MTIRIAQLIALTLTTTAVGCAATPAAPNALNPADLPVPAAAPAVDQAGSEMCTVVRRGANDGVKDARIAEHWPNKNYGAAPSSFAGNVAGGARQTLLAFDLPEIPEGATITSAKLRLHKCVCGGSGVTAHKVTASWSEHDVTWSTFDGAYEREAFSSLPVGSDERTSLDVTELARGWADGSVENHGILLAQANANTAFSTSEVTEASERPALEICWTN